MCFRVGSATASRRRRSQARQAPTLPALASLDLSKPWERRAHDFLLRATNKRDRMWNLLTLRRHGDALLCIVRWARAESPAKPFSLAEVSLTEIAVCWRDYPSIEAAQAAMERHCAVPAMSKDAA